MKNRSTILQIRNLTKIFPPNKAALDHVNLTIGQGDFVVIIGSSGAGKSTLLRCFNRLITPSSGEVIFRGVDLTKLSEAEVRRVRREMGMIFQQFNLVKRSSVLQNVLAGRLGYSNRWLSLFGKFSHRDREVAFESLKQVGLLDFACRRADTLSGGEQQRVGIARALAQKPALILADEPTASLDPKLSQTIMEIMKTINEEYQMSVVMSLHVIDLAVAYARRIIGLRKGQVIFDGNVSDLTPEMIDHIYGEEA
ncbi:MAG: phosphonate ABC transporter ATP-binding protein [Candidatus Tectomicrobia bacterium]|nr:phosphonate ABC transporter ATP-binding protein [Candidatus Tectomicrobia bacterium]